MSATALKLGDFSALSKNYSSYRPGYCDNILRTVVAQLPKPIQLVDWVDVGAGTGIWTRQVEKHGPRTMIAVEPNAEMLEQGRRDSSGLPIAWYQGAAESLPLQDEICDVISMASSFHWTDPDRALAEFHRCLRPDGRFVAAWNPRIVERNPLLTEIESTLYTFAPHISRVSSGRSGITHSLTERLSTSRHFADSIYLEGEHISTQTPEQYIGAWLSVNDVRAQAGEAIFSQFIDYLRERLASVETLQTTYMTRAWIATRRN